MNDQPVVTLTERAQDKLRSLLEREGRDDLGLRLAVQPGGCSGLIYQMFFDNRYIDGDEIFEGEGVEVRVDRMSVPYLQGSTLDFKDDLNGGFSLDNPNSGDTCACGSSFS